MFCSSSRFCPNCWSAAYRREVPLADITSDGRRIPNRPRARTGACRLPHVRWDGHRNGRLPFAAASRMDLAMPSALHSNYPAAPRCKFRSGNPIGLGVQRTAEGLQAGLVECLAACGMCMNGRSNILQARTHFERQSKCSGQLRHTLADGLEPEKYAIVLPGQDANEAIAAFGCKRPAVGPERELGDDGVGPRSFDLLRSLTNGDDLRIGEANGRNSDLVPDRGPTSDGVGDYLALSHRSVCEHRLTRDVADGENPPHRGPAAIIDANEWTVHGETEGLEIQGFRARSAPRGDQHLIGGNECRFL